MPSIFAPSETRKRQRSWTCGSHAAFEIIVLPGASDGGHDGVLGRHHRRLVEVDVRRRVSVPCELVALVELERGAELGEGVDVRVEPAAADHVAARRRHARAAERARAAGRRAGTRRGSGSRARWSTSCVTTSARARAPRGRPSTRRRRRGAASSSSIVSTSRIRGTFVERDRLVGEQARGEDRQRAVLVAGGADAPESGLPPSITNDSAACLTSRSRTRSALC